MAKILLVDKKKDVRDFVVRFFRERNFEVLSAANGRDALLSVRRDQPDIVLLELKMEDMDGIEILRRIMESKRGTKVIIVSSVNDIETKDEARRLGAVSYLTKPIALSELMDAVLDNLGREKRFFKLKKAAHNA